ncbi:MAG: hypothetical protein CMJ02_00205 [Pelagibacteraceae bacterium]|jgi:hypothetical protein|nr:hypothetical protein [Pelagibacteraceae bacterium]OUV89578.1 MAG: hypothetical protein CBD06_00275 [Pelagibacteraceae bacterium TMED146]|tara:strand:+ start:485 stop:772 length:288 start_codon:yes stop_codon:yes gene_type:complete
MKGTNILLGFIALILALFFGLQIEEQYRDVRYLNNCKKDIKANGIKTDDPIAYCAGLIRQDPYLFTYNRGFVAKYLQENISNAPQQPAPNTEQKK